MRKPAALVIAAVLLVPLGGCGGGSGTKADPAAAAKASASASASASAAAAEKAAEARQKAAAAKKARETAVFKECQAATGALDDDLSDLNSRLSVGLSFEKYGGAVGDAKVDYDKMIRAVNGSGVSSECLSKVATRLETGLNAYIKAYNTWNDCINATYCTFDKGTPELAKAQKSWVKGGIASGKADAALSGLQP